jgi:hypothetical protein
MEFCSDSLDCLLTFLFRIQANEPADQFADLYHSTVKVINEGRKGGIQREGGGPDAYATCSMRPKLNFRIFARPLAKAN